MMEFHQTLQHIDIHKMNICIRMKRARGQFCQELLPFVILNAFCLCIDSAYAGKSTYTTAFAETI